MEIQNINGYAIEIKHDDWTENPREWAESTLCTAHRRYTFGGEKLPEGCQDIEEAFDVFLAERGLTRNQVIWLPVYLYDHSGLALSTKSFSNRWDSGHLGFIYETRASIRKEFGVKRISADLEERICDRLRYELEELEHWSNGSAYRYAFFHWGWRDRYTRDEEDYLFVGPFKSPALSEWWVQNKAS